MFFKCLVLSLFLCFNSITLLSASRILAILPVGDKNHFEMYLKFLNELRLRDHEITFLNPFIEESRYNLKLIDIREASTKLESSTLSIDQVETISKGMINDLLTIHNNVFNYFNLFIQNVTYLHKTKEVIECMRSEGVEFDLVIIELFFSDGDYIFGNKFEAPVIAISTFPLLQFGNSRLSNPNSLLQEQLFSVKNYRYGHHTCFWERLINSIEKTAHMFAYNNYMSLFHSPDISNMHKPSSKYIMENTALILSNSHYTLYGAKFNFPNVVEIGGIHIEEKTEKLPWDLQTFIDGAEHGVIYFCMGSMLKASTIPDDKRDALVKVFSRLPQRVLWKWENDTMPGKSDNVKIAKWMPQRDILAHPNVKLFISHGGLLGTTEAVHCGVPIIGIPFYGDQAGNIEAVASHGAGLRLDYNDINEHNLYNKITEILNNPLYAENAKALSVRFRDRPQTPLETAVYWTEYVIRHKGAPHLRSAAVELTWYQYLLLDVIAFLLLVSLTTILSFYYTLKFIIRKLFKKSESTNKSTKKVKKS